MKWRCRRIGARRRAIKMWHDWFAWFPVRVPSTTGKKRVWLEKVRRRGDFIRWGGYEGTSESIAWEYKEK